MLGKYALANNVRTTLRTAINSVASSLVVDAATGVFKNPPNPSGSLGILTLIDSMTQPTKTEIVTYTAVADNGNGTLTLSGVSRGQEGTVAQSFAAGAIVFQGVTAGQLDSPLIAGDEDHGVVTVSAELDVDQAVVLRRFDLPTSQMVPQWALNADGSYNLIIQNLTNSTTPFKLDRATGNATFIGSVTAAGFTAGSGPPTPVIANSDLTISSTNGFATLAKFGANTIGAFLGLAKARGTAASPALIANGDTIGVLSAYSARSSTVWAQSASINFEADGTQTTTSAPARIVFTTCAVGSTSPTEVLRLNADNSATFVGAVNIGPKPTAPPIAGALAAVSGTNGLAAGSIVRTSADTAGAVLALGKARGTPTAQTIVINGDTLGRIDAYAARTSAAWTNVASITFETDGAQTTTSMPTRIVFRTTPSASLVQAEALRINADKSAQFAGNVGIGVAPSANADEPAKVNGSVTANGFQVASIVDYGNNPASLNINWRNGGWAKVQLMADPVPTFFTAPRGPAELVLLVNSGPVGGGSLTFPATVDWASGAAPSFATANRLVAIRFLWDGSKYRGSHQTHTP